MSNPGKHVLTTVAVRISGLVLVLGATSAPGTVAAQQPPGQAAGQLPVQVQAFTPPSISTPSSPAVSTPAPVTYGPTEDALAGQNHQDHQGQAVPGHQTVSGQDPYEGNPLIPPNVEGEPHAAAGGDYCYVGPHPVDTRVVPGTPWDPTSGQHMRPYPPIDTRLFAFRDGCYYFTGDPRDFGYAGQTHSYYGAHPVLNTYGGGWCFMMGGHGHLWAPWSPYFTVVGPWHYWHGAYDPFFWSYWPYYSFYYRSYYPHYYGGGRFHRGGYRVAPPIRSLPASTWRGSAPGRTTAPTVRGMPPNQMHRPSPNNMGAPMRPVAPSATPGRPGWGPPSRPGFSPGPGGFAPRPSFSPGPGSFAPRSGGMGSSPGPGSFAPRGGGMGSPGGGFRGGGMGSPGGGFRGGGMAPGGGFRGGGMGSPGGGFRGGGGRR